jgi:phage tail-like protein
MASGTRNDPLLRFNFRVEIDGIAVAAFSEISGLSSETAVIEYREGGDPSSTTRKLPGATRHGNIVLKRGVTTNRSLWDWRKSVIDGAVQRRNGSIVMLDERGADAMRWNFRQAWPAKWEGPTLAAKGNDVAIETLEIAHEGLELA